jgi:cytoskeletal protein RodZ
MTQSEALHHRITARDAAQRLLARLTTGAVVGAIAGVGVLGYVSAQTIPGNSSATASNAAAASTGSTSTSSSSTYTSSSSTSSSSSGLSTSSGSVSSSSGSSTPVAVTGGSR